MKRKPYRVIVADPPWKFGDRLPGKGRGASKRYRCMDLERIEEFDLPPIGKNAVLFLWRVSAMQEEALRVLRAWGFTLKSEIVWQKLTKKGKKHFGMGRIVRASHETCLVAVRGRMRPKVRNVRSTFEAPVGDHSEKPAAFFRLVESMFDGPRIELFARKRRRGWAARGDQLPKRRAA